MLGIADLIGGEWPAKARAAALALEETGDKADTKDLAIRLLADLRSIFDRDKRKEYLSAENITSCLANIDESPWLDYKNGKPINSNGFAKLLEPFGIYSRKVTTGPDKGNMRWYRADFEDTWTRYLPQEGAESTTRASTASTALKNKANPASQASTAGEACDGEKPRISMEWSQWRLKTGKTGPLQILMAPIQVPAIRPRMTAMLTNCGS